MLPFSATWTGLKGIRSSEMLEKAEYYMISLMLLNCGVGEDS